MTEIDDLPKLVLKEKLGYPVVPNAKVPLTEYQKGVTQRASQKLVRNLSSAAAGIRILSPLDSTGSVEE